MMETSPPRTDAAAAAVGARDLFVLRRITGTRFVHLGGSGRGAGWAGLVEVSTDEEASLREALRSRLPVRSFHDDKVRIFGPYYAHAAAFVPVTNDVVVVFGSESASVTEVRDDQLHAAATMAADAVDSVTPAKQLADELEELEAVRAAATVDVDDVAQTMRDLARIGAESLSCEVGAIYLADGDRMEVQELGWSLTANREQVKEALKEVLEQGRFPFCVQDASVVPLPSALVDEPGVRSYYLLELTGVARGVLFFAHTDAAPRGFTLLCRRLGVAIADVVAAQLGVALTREWCRQEAGRLHGEFAKLDAFA
jgi:hypothetical protein